MMMNVDKILAHDTFILSMTGYGLISQVVYDKEQKGPVSALSYLNGLLISAIGQKVTRWYL